MKYIILFIVMAIPFHKGFTQNKLSGTIDDAENKAPLEQVSIYIPELEKGTATNEMVFMNLKIFQQVVLYWSFPQSVLKHFPRP